MGFSDYALDTFMAQEASSFSWKPESIHSAFLKRDTWLDEFVLRRIFHGHVPDDRVALAFIMVRRAVVAVDEWEAMCSAAIVSLRKPSTYFSTLQHCESCLAATWQGLAFGRNALGRDLFAKGDGSIYERLNVIYNTGRHFDPSALPHGALHAVWLAEEHVRTHTHSLKLVELREVVCTLGRIASEIVSGPKT